jgi:hypothetical protein
MFLIIKSQTDSDKLALKFMEEIRNIIGGTISEYKILFYQLKIEGTYKNRQVECEYRRYPRSSSPNPLPKIRFNLRPLEAFQIRYFPFFYPKITHNITLRKGALVYKYTVAYSSKPVQEVITNILDELVQAEKKFEDYKVSSI